MAPHLNTKFAVTRGKYEALPRVGFPFGFFFATLHQAKFSERSDLALTSSSYCWSDARQNQIVTARCTAVVPLPTVGSEPVHILQKISCRCIFLALFDHCWHSELSRSSGK